MTTRLKKNRRRRGATSISAGHGRFRKHHMILFGKVGMRYFHETSASTLNIDRLCSLLPLLLDVTQFGYFKVLGKGMLPEGDAPLLVVKAKLISQIKANAFYFYMGDDSSINHNMALLKNGTTLEHYGNIIPSTLDSLGQDMVRLQENLVLTL